MQEIDLNENKKHRDDAKNVQTNMSLEEEVNDELDRLGQGGRWVWTLFFIATLPNILNGFHVSSYVFLSKMPDNYWCSIAALGNTSWTPEERLRISTE